jgi:MFS family permease
VNVSSLSNQQIWGTVLAVSLGWLFSAIDIILLILFQEEIAADLNLEIQAVRIAIGVGLMGSAIGGLFFAQLGDRWGRVKALAISIMIYSVATGLMAFSHSKPALFGLRFLAGVGTGAEWSIGFALLSEVWSEKSRGRVGGLVAGMFNLGTFCAIGLFQSPLGWRGSFGLMVLPTLFAISLRRWIPESQVWLSFNEAKRNGTLPHHVLKEANKSPLISAFTGHSKWVTYRLIILFTLMNLGFYSFSTVFINYLKASVSSGGLGLDKSGQLPFHLILNVASLVSVILAGSLSDFLGRRRASFIFCLIGFIGFSFLNVNLNAMDQDPQLNSSQLMFPFSLCCMGFGINGVMGIFAPELFPTYLRSTSPGVSQNLGKGIGGMMGPPLAGMLVISHGFPMVLSLPGWLFIAIAAVVYTFPEVGGKTFDD